MIFAIKPFEIHDGDGIRTTVFFKGCSLRCQWCHNPESWSLKAEPAFDGAHCRDCGKCAAVCAAGAHQIKNGTHIFIRDLCENCGKCMTVCPAEALTLYGDERSPEEIAEEVLSDELFMKESGGGVTFSGGEPLLQADFCRALALIIKSHGVHLAIDTCGNVPREAFENILDLADVFLYDLKAIDEETHKKCTGASNRLILENLRYLDTVGKPIEIRYPYVPGMNDGEVTAIGEFVKTLSSVTRLRVLGYHDFARSKYASLGLPYPLPDTPVPSKDEIGKVIASLVSMGVPACGSNDL